MFIGKVSELTGATRKAIRHYESIGLMAPSKRRGSYRVYDEHDMKVIHMTRRAQELGFNLSELKEVVSRKTIEKTASRYYIGVCRQQETSKFIFKSGE